MSWKYNSEDTKIHTVKCRQTPNIVVDGNDLDLVGTIHCNVADNSRCVIKLVISMHGFD